MGITHLSGLQVAGVPTMGVTGSIPLTTGNYFFVNSVTGSDGNTGAADSPLATLATAISKCTAAEGDTIVLEQGHAETITAAGGITVNVAGINIIGLGTGANRPRFTFSTAATASFLVTSANVQIANIVGISGIDALTNPFNIQAAGCTLGSMIYGPVEWQDPASATQAVRAVLTNASADNLRVNLKVAGITSGGTAPVNAIRLVGADGAIVNCDFYGRASTAMVEFVTTACSNVEVYGYMYNSGVTNFTKDIVDTVTGSTWYADFEDGAAGFPISGGSGTALGPASGATVIADLAVPTADATTNALERDVIGNKTDAAVTAVGTTKSIIAYAKGVLTWIGTITNTAGTATLGAVLGDFANTTLIQKLNVPALDSTANAAVTEVVGNKTDTAVYAPGTTKSLTAYLKGGADIQESAVQSATAVMVNGNTLFTVAGGPIEILDLMSICQTANDGTASTLQYQSTGTLGTTTATISGASASLATAAAGTTVVFQGTTLATAPLVSANAANINGTARVVVPAGLIKAVIGVGSTTGTWAHFIRYRPLARGVTVS